jgi:hypothetical protein
MMTITGQIRMFFDIQLLEGNSSIAVSNYIRYLEEVTSMVFHNELCERYEETNYTHTHMQ